MKVQSMMRKDVTIITGGGRGIGATIAHRMAKETAVLVVGRTLDSLLTVCGRINAAGGDAHWVVGDVCDPQTAATVVKTVEQRRWNIRNLVCNAAVAKGGPLVEMDSKDWYDMFNVNVHGTYHFIKACAPAMIEAKSGSICIISSIGGLKGFKNESGYCATKFALVGLAQSLAHEYAKHNITVVPICPGYVDSEMTDRVINGKIKYRGMTREQAVDLIESANPQKRLLSQTEIAEAVALVCSSAGTKYSGKTLDFLGEMDARVLKLVHWISKNAAKARELLIPISGGSDSALCFALCAMAYPEKTVGIFIGPSENLRNRQWFESRAKVIYETIDHPLSENPEIARWAKFLTVSNARGAWLVGSRNHTEELTGFYSLVSDLAKFRPLSKVWKSEVMELCKLIGVPSEITASSRRADPDCGRPAELAEIPLEMIDTYLRVQEGELPQEKLSAMSTAQREYLSHMVAENHFKRFLPTTGPSVNLSDAVAGAN